jgi:hypothetical protein
LTQCASTRGAGAVTGLPLLFVLQL